MTTTYRMHGTTDDTDTCEFCGKIELRSVVMLAALVDGEETGELIYADSTCAARKLAQSGKRVSAARVRDASAAAGRVMTQAREFASEMSGVTVNAYIAANSVAYLNAAGGDACAAIAAAKSGYADLAVELAAIDRGELSGTRFARLLPVL